MCEDWLLNKPAGWEVGFDEIGALLDYVGAVDCDNWGGWMVFCAGMDDGEY